MTVLQPLRWLMRRLMPWLVLLLSLLAAPAQAQAGKAAPFDHLRTGFALTGTHNSARCESCHQGGVLKGTPRDCVSCHVSGQRLARGNVVMTANHLATTQSCDSCHGTQSFAGARFNHGGVTAGSCASCHNGGNAGGRPANHVAYAANAATASAGCDSCHKGGFASWTGARVHASFTITTGCAGCHGGNQQGAAGKPATPIHSGVTSCEACHTAGNWASAKVDHAGFGAATQCAGCHNGSAASGKPATHMPAGQTNCFSCHATTGWKPSRWTHSQQTVAGQCASCHTGGYPPADGRSANHVPYAAVAATASANCDTCHRAGFTAWAPAKVHSAVSIGAQCASCHSGAFPPAVGKPATAIHANVTGNCESCHKSTSNWAAAKVDHSGFNAATNCAQCHNGSAATGKSGTHIPVGASNCFSCHSVTAWTPTKWNHTQVTVTAQCASCHTGGYPPADGRVANHIPYATVPVAAAANCDSCHRGSTTSWANGRFHANFSVSTGCFSCHTGAYLAAVGKPATAIHANVTGNCESCHKSTSSWSSAKVDHSGFNAATNCAQCHNGSAATGKPGTHIPVGASNCFSCHSVTAWTPTKWNHTQVTVTAQCASCHTGGYPPADGRSANHVPYAAVAATASANCDTCHRAGFTAWAPAKVHSAVSIGAQCASCHSGAFPPAVGKPATAIHANVTGNCESCHKSTSNWAAAKVDHSGFNAATNCAQCHNGSAATGKSGTHIPVGASNCFSCHATTGWTPTKWNHTQVTVTAQCASCHTGGYPPADGRSANHVPYAAVAATASANCDTCHRAGFTAWAPAKVHSAVSIGAQCASCHSGAFPPAVGKPATAIHANVTGNCESCHKSTSNWAAAKVDHSGFNAATNCAQCHNGSAATGKSGTHIPVGASNCFSCHATTGWTPTKWNHTQVTVTAQCASCHTGGYPPADGRSANHVPYAAVAATASANCDTCHRAGFTAWAPAKVHSAVSIGAQCASCHSGAFPPAVGKPATAIHANVTGNCESCHKSTSSWSSAKVDHSGFNGGTNCAQCHNGSAATGKSGTHIPVGASNCFSCHATTGWTPTKWNHTQVTVTAQCASCHTGGYPPADGRSANHVPYAAVAATASANCDTCHRAGFTAWAPAKVHSAVSIGAQCASCHSGAFPPAVGKPATAIHANVTGNCESCHKSTSNWAAAKVDHSGFNAATNCAQCHNGSAATGKSGTHIPVGASNCFSCHATTGWTPTKWNHTQVTVTAQCASCHTGGYPPADGRSANHVPYAAVAATASANCDTCHRAGFTAWAPAKVHSAVSIGAQCASCHSGAFPPAVGKPATAIHANVTGNCESCHKSTSNWAAAKVDHSGFNAATNCAQCHNGSAATGKSGTHIPVGASNCFSCHSVTAWTPTKWNHTQVTVTAQCASCHTGGYPPADGRVANHIPYATVPVAAAANCDSCHRGSTTSWANGRFHANFSVSTGCFSCHTGAYLAAVGKPATAIHANVTGNCESCHKSTSSWSSAKVDHSGFNAATNCAQCHNGSAATGKPGTHIPVGASNCFSCHSVTAWTPTKWNHTQVTVAAQCASCHTGSYPPADGRVANHIPYATVPVAAAANCDSCHRGSTTSWANGRFHANFSVSTGCFSCHTGAYLAAVGKPATAIHANVTGNCESCHKSTSSWSSAKVDHSGFNAATNCAQCHNGSAATGKPGTHVPVGASNCFSCHSVTAWTPTKWNHTQVTVAAQCASCHTGGYPPADGRVANHIPYATVPVAAAANCDSCHRGSTTSWANGRFHANFSVSSGCFSCHTGAYLAAVGKPATAIHANVTGNCESCHKSTSSWSQVSYTHGPANAVGTGTCDTCHNGSTATGKPATHIPVPAGAARCDSCHRSQAGWRTSVTMNHSVVSTGTCKSCHNGAYLSAGSQGALAKPGNHIPEAQLLNGAAMDCNACHSGTSSWGSPRMNHNSSQGNGAGWCKACHQSGTSYAGGMERKSLTHEKSSGVTDCSQSGCHRPLGNKGNAYTKWD